MAYKHENMLNFIHQVKIKIAKRYFRQFQLVSYTCKFLTLSYTRVLTSRFVQVCQDIIMYENAHFSIVHKNKRLETT